VKFSFSWPWQIEKGAAELNDPILTLSYCQRTVEGDLAHRTVIAGAENIIDRGRKIIESRARDDDRIASPMSFLGNAQESTALILTEFKMKPLTFDLNFFSFEDAVHFELSGV
jgi:hypothetical protein